MHVNTVASAYLRWSEFKGKFVRTTFIVALGLVLSAPARADINMSEAEYQLLPDYCKAQANVSNRHYQKYYRPERTQQWKSALGSNYSAYHHYCWAIVSISRAYRASSGSRAAFAMRAIADIGYTLDNSTPDSILSPLIYTKLGEAYLLMHDDRNAEAAFQKAWEADPSYWRPYVWWAERLKQRGKTREALAVAEEGLKNAPGTKALKNLIRELRSSGKKSDK